MKSGWLLTAAVAASAGCVALAFAVRARARKQHDLNCAEDHLFEAAQRQGHQLPDAPLNALGPRGPEISTPATSTPLRAEAHEWAARGASLPLDGSDTTRDGQEVLSKLQCYVRALTLDNRCSLAWYKLGAILSEPFELPFTFVNGDGHTTNVATDLECTRRAIEVHLAESELQPASAPVGWILGDAWFNLAVATRRRFDNDDDDDEDFNSARPSRGVKTTVTVAGTEYTFQAMYRLAVEADPSDGEKWLYLARAMDTDEGTSGDRPTRVTLTVTSTDALNGTVFAAPSHVTPPHTFTTTSREMYLMVAQRRDAYESEAWHDLAVSLAALRPDAPSNRQQKIPLHTARDVMERVRAAQMPTPLRNFRLPCDTTHQSGGTPYVAWTPAACLVASLSLMPANPRAWSDLAQELLMTATASTSVEPVDCLAEALKLNPEDCDSWTCLASCLEAGRGPRGGPDALVLGKHVSQWTTAACVLESVLQNPESAEAWHNLAVSHPKGAVMPVGRVGLHPSLPRPGAQITQIDCYTKCVELRRDWAEAWMGLGRALHDVSGALRKESRSIGGRRMTAQDCFQEAVRCNDSLPDAWMGLAATMDDDLARVDVGRGQLFTRSQCAQFGARLAGHGDDEDNDYSA